MELIGKVHEAARNATLLEDVEEGYTIQDWETEVIIVLDDEHGGAELENVFGGREIRWIPAAVVSRSFQMVPLF